MLLPMDGSFPIARVLVLPIIEAAVNVLDINPFTLRVHRH